MKKRQFIQMAKEMARQHQEADQILKDMLGTPERKQEFASPKGFCPICQKQYRGWALANDDIICSDCGAVLIVSLPK